MQGNAALRGKLFKEEKDALKKEKNAWKCLDDEGVCAVAKGKSEGEGEDSPGEEEKKRGEFVFLSWLRLYSRVGTLDSDGWHWQYRGAYPPISSVSLFGTVPGSFAHYGRFGLGV